VKAVARLDRAGNDRVEEVIASGEFPRYLGNSSVDMLVHRWPQLALDGNFFSTAHDSVAASLRPEVVSSVVGPLRDLIWVAGADGGQGQSEESRILLARAANSLRLLQAWRA
jgi:hypothetical protein